MGRKISGIAFIALIFQINCAHQGFSTQVKTITEKESISASELKQLIDNKNSEYILIDVRTEKEYKSGHIPTATNIHYREIEDHTKEISKNKLIIVYCKVGGRAGIAKEKLVSLGYENVINFGGINSWDYELVK